MTSYDIVRLSASLFHFRQHPWNLGSVWAERTDRGRVHPKGANSMATSGHDWRKDLVGIGRAISVLFLA